jgi:hypothetical protein
MKKYVAIDTETTGFDPVRDSVVEVAAVMFNEQGQVLDTYERRFCPRGGSMPPGAERVHGISYDEVKDLAPYDEYTSADVRDFCAGHELIGHNIKFDLGFLKFSKKAIPRIWDTLALARKKWPRGRNKLETACRRAGIMPPEGSYHGALADSIQTLKLFLYLEFDAKIEQLEADVTPPPIRVYTVANKPGPTIKLKAGDKPFMDNGDIVIPFNSPIEDRWWMKDAVFTKKIGERTYTKLDKYGNEIRVTDDVIETTPQNPGVKFKTIPEIEKPLI